MLADPLQGCGDKTRQAYEYIRAHPGAIGAEVNRAVYGCYHTGGSPAWQSSLLSRNLVRSEQDPVSLTWSWWAVP